jgi:hypothetical protein
MWTWRNSRPARWASRSIIPPTPGAGIAINFSEENFLGRGQSLRFGVSTVEGGQSFNFAFTEPNFLARDVALGLNLFYEQTQSQDRSFDTEDYGFSTSFTFPASENGRFGLSYSLDQREINFGDQAANSSPILTADAGARITSAVGLRYIFDNRATGLNPNAGVFLDLRRMWQVLGAMPNTCAPRARDRRTRHPARGGYAARHVRGRRAQLDRQQQLQRPLLPEFAADARLRHVRPGSTRHQCAQQ